MNDDLNATMISSDPAGDHSIALAARFGDERAFGILFERYQPKIFAVALRHTRVPEDAEDVVQQTFEKAFIHLHAFESKSSFCTWLTRIAINEALMLLRGGRTLREVPIEYTNGDEPAMHSQEVPDSRPDPEASYLKREKTKVLCAAIRRLKPRTRMAIELRELAQLSTRETARRMGLSVGAVKAQVFHGRAKLRKTLLHFKARPKGPRRLTVSTQNNPTGFSYHLRSH